METLKAKWYLRRCGPQLQSTDSVNVELCYGSDRKSLVAENRCYGHATSHNQVRSCSRGTMDMTITLGSLNSFDMVNGMCAML